MPKNSLNKPTKKSLYEAKVKSLDSLGADAGQFIEQEGLNVIESIVGDFVQRVHANINAEKDFVTTGGINDIEIKAEGGKINVYAAKHLIYQDRGVNGSKKKLYDTPHSYTDKMPPVQVFIDWIKTKNIQLRDNEKYDENSPSPFKELSEDEQIKKAAWGMAMKVFQEGFKPRNIYSKEIPQLIEDLQAEIAELGVQTIMQNVDVKPEAKRVILPKANR